MNHVSYWPGTMVAMFFDKGLQFMLTVVTKVSERWSQQWGKLRKIGM